MFLSQFKISAPFDTKEEMRAVIYFLHSEGVKPAETQQPGYSQNVAPLW